MTTSPIPLFLGTITGEPPLGLEEDPRVIWQRYDASQGEWVVLTATWEYGDELALEYPEVADWRVPHDPQLPPATVGVEARCEPWDGAELRDGEWWLRLEAPGLLVSNTVDGDAAECHGTLLPPGWRLVGPEMVEVAA